MRGEYSGTSAVSKEISAWLQPRAISNVEYIVANGLGTNAPRLSYTLTSHTYRTGGKYKKKKAGQGRRKPMQK